MSGWMHWIFHTLLTVGFTMLVLRILEKQVCPYRWVNLDQLGGLMIHNIVLLVI